MHVIGSYMLDRMPPMKRKKYAGQNALEMQKNHNIV